MLKKTTVRMQYAYNEVMFLSTMQRLLFLSVICIDRRAVALEATWLAALDKCFWGEEFLSACLYIQVKALCFYLYTCTHGPSGRWFMREHLHLLFCWLCTYPCHVTLHSVFTRGKALSKSWLRVTALVVTEYSVIPIIRKKHVLIELIYNQTYA